MTTLKRRTATIPIYQGDDAERLAELRMDVAIAEQRAQQTRAHLEAAEAADDSARYGDEADVTSEDLAAAEATAQDARDTYDAFVDEAAERAVPLTVQHIGSRRFRELVAEHPPRMVKDDEDKDVVHDDDFDFGVNVSTFGLALLTYVDPEDPDIRTMLTPELKGKKGIVEFVDDELSDGDVEKAWMAAYWLNRVPSADPKALRFSQNTAATSE